ncbi:MAG TPA: polysaccharide biosynthesis tyrosine autokinase [Alphaproteobacteria bacterium]|jgi:capsular exopolysaccharide synthesis family protein
MQDFDSHDSRPWRYSLVEGNRPSRHGEREIDHYAQGYDERFRPDRPQPPGYGGGYGGGGYGGGGYGGGGYGGGYGRQGGHERSLGDIFNSLWRRKFAILGGMLAAAVVAYVVASSMTPRYATSGMLAVETRPLFIPQIGVQPQPWAPDISIPRTEVQVLRSRDLIETVARKLNLDRDPEFNPYAQEPSFFKRITGGIASAVRDVGATLGLVKPASSQAPNDDAVWSAVVDNVLDRLTIGTDGRSYAIYVNFESESPELSSTITNALMQGFIAKQIETSNQTLMDANGWIKQRSVELLKDVEDANKKIQDYRVSHGLVETRAGTVSSQQLNEINTQLSTAQADLAQAEARYQQAQTESSQSNSSSTAMEVLSSPLIQRLREREAEAAQKQAEMSSRLAPAHPQRKAVAQELSTLRAQINTEIGKILKSLQSQVTIARSREQSLSRQQASLQSRATTSAGSEIELNQLTQEAETKRNVYQNFLATAQQTAEPSRINQANSRIVSAAPTPILPSSPNKKLIVMGGVLIGFLLTSALTLLFGDLNRGFERSDDIEDTLGLPVLGALPLFRRRRSNQRGLDQSIVGQPHESVIAETLRGIRIALGCRRASGRCKVILVTSSQPGEGKTTFTSSLGAVAAQDGLRVLIVDSDLRRPQFHRMFKAEPGPALQDVLEGTQSLASVVRTDPESGAHCLTTQERLDHPVNLLTSVHWNSFLQQARGSYDLIILDSPPVMHVADALTLADHVDSAIFVIAHGSTPRRTVEEALKRFKTTGRQISGVVLSKVPALQVSHTYYSGYAA